MEGDITRLYNSFRCKRICQLPRAHYIYEQCSSEHSPTCRGGEGPRGVAGDDVDSPTSPPSWPSKLALLLRGVGTGRVPFLSSLTSPSSENPFTSTSFLPPLSALSLWRSVASTRASRHEPPRTGISPGRAYSGDRRENVPAPRSSYVGELGGDASG